MSAVLRADLMNPFDQLKPLREQIETSSLDEA